MLQPIQNIEKMYYAPITKDDNIGATFGTPKYLEGIREVGLKPKLAEGKYYHEGKKVISQSVFTEADLEAEMTDMLKDDQVVLFGHKLSKDNGILKSANDIAPNVVTLFKAIKSNGKARYVVVYNTVWSISDETYKQQEEKIDYQVKKYKVTAMPLKFNGAWQNVFDEEDGMTDAKFFAAVPVPEIKSET